MPDENLPSKCLTKKPHLLLFDALTPLAFYLKPSSDGLKHNATVLLTHHGSEAVPEYFLRHPDPSLPSSKNRYAVALYDIFNPEILFGEILLIPQWTLPTLSQEEIRLNGGVPPAPQPLLPTEFTIQLYNPDQQVLVKYHTGSWNSAPHWEFEMPQQSFRQPSNSVLDRTQNDPTAAETTPKFSFKWKKDGKLSKDYVCFLAGKSTSLHNTRKSQKEPDITIALFRRLKEIMIYEPNLSRVDMEDLKGLEVVLLLGAVVLREVFNGQLKDVFNIIDPPARDGNENAPRNPSKPLPGSTPTYDSPSYSAVKLPRHPSNPARKHPLRIDTAHSRLPPTDPRSQWEIDAETVRLKKQVEQEERERRRAEHAETKRVKKMIEAEERDARRKQAEVEKETERLKRIYAAEQPPAQLSTRPHLPLRQDRPRQRSAPLTQTPFPTPPAVAVGSPAQRFLSRKPSSQYLEAPKNPSSSGSVGGSHSAKNVASRVKTKRSVFGMRSVSDEQPQRLVKKQSAMW